MADANQPTLPLSLADIEGLVKTLYTPGSPKKITETEATLRVIQRSPQGWEVADALLNSNDESVRFFGALTFTVKINADSAQLNEQDSQVVLYKLIHHLVSSPASSTATRKLCSTLAQYFCKPISGWRFCLHSLIASFASQQPVLDDALDGQPAPVVLLPQLSEEQLLILLDFAMNLADETKKMSNSPNRTVHHRMIDNTETQETLLRISFERGINCLSAASTFGESIGERLATASLKCFTGWVFYGQTEFKPCPEKLRHLRSNTHFALACLEYGIDDAMELIADILENYPQFLESNDREMLWSTVKGPWGLGLLENVDNDTIALARIIVAYGQSLLDSKVLYKEPTLPHHQEVMAFLHGLLKYPEPIGIDDEIAPIALDFWSSYVSTISDEVFELTESSPRPAWLEQASTHVFQVMSEFVNKIIYPDAAVSKSWDDESKKTFKVFRVDVRDIIQEAFNVLHDALLDQFIEFTTRSLHEKRWLELEAGLFCLISVSDLSAQPVDARLQTLFQLPLFTIMLTTPEIPSVTRRGVVDTVAAFNDFFLRHAEYLPQVLPFLLNALAQPSLAQSAAKSFASLCSQCRKSLTNELPSFFEMYQQFSSYATATEYTRSRVLEGIAAIVQAQDTDERRLAGTRQLFEYIAQDAMKAVNSVKEHGDAESGLEHALTTLKCLLSIGRAMQATDEEAIDLDSERPPSEFWTRGPGKEIQNQIINFVSYLSQLFPADADICETACNILRVGAKEVVPGPFVLPPSATVNFILKSSIQTPRLPYVLETACCWISSNKNDKSGEYQAECQRLLHHILGLMQMLQHPRNDPEIAVGCIEVIQKFININPIIFMGEAPDVLKAMFDFSIESLRSPEVLPKRAACQLWRDIFELSGSTKSEHQNTGKEIVNHFGASVVSALIYNVCGEVDGTSLPNVTDPLRKCINAEPRSRMWITQALAAQPLLSQANDDPALQEIIRKFVEGSVR
ncbi:ARM repeat-containing protein [Sporormia fimetaria CBS 119925]|uniref:ARM repeat-containing protein n=1 Tax=Sporormia fimetaria CBS 119925 TaxID=1340428 RepID=A0A6A6VHZ1_9PLEO|nr:ARM repeat-containing protein [Sporormia fimetaria CBS 119925]